MEDTNNFNLWKEQIEYINPNNIIECLRIIELNISNKCNLKCPFCPQGNNWNNYKQTFIDINLIEEISKQLNNIKYNGYICIAGHGEPTLHPRFLEIIKILRNFNVVLVTNGIPITSEQIQEIKNYCQIKVSVHTLSQLDSFKEKFKNSNAIFRNHDMKNPQMNLYNRAGNLNIFSEKILHKCNYPFYKIMIDIDGKYKRCEADWNSETKTAYDIYNCSIDEYFRTKLDDIRKNIIINRQNCDLCKNCNINGELIGNKFVDFIKNFV